MKKLAESFQKLLKYTGCNCIYTWIVLTLMIWTAGLMSGAAIETIEIVMVLMTLFIIVSVLYFLVSAPDDKEQFFQKLQNKGIDEAKIKCPDLQVFSVPKQIGTCPYFSKEKGPLAFETSFFYLCNDSVTIYTKCAQFHIFKDDIKIEKKRFIKVKKKKETCEEIYEFYYYNMNYVNYEGKQIVFYFIDGSKRAFTAEKKPAKKVIKALREKMRVVMARKTIHAYKKAFPVQIENFPNQLNTDDNNMATPQEGESH